MRVSFDENGYVKYWVIRPPEGHIVLENGIEVPDVVDIEDIEALRAFDAEFESYHLVDGVLVKDDAKLEEVHRERHANRLRRQREVECFEIINRSNLWYNTLNDEQKAELDAWYHAWLDVTDTLVVPEKPEWLK